MKVAFKLLVAFFCVHLTASAPLRSLRIRNMTFLFVESPNGDKVKILYAPKGKLGSFPVGPVDLTTENAVSEDDFPETAALTNDDDLTDDNFNPELDAPRVESSVIQAPKFKSSCDKGHRVDKHGNCRRIW